MDPIRLVLISTSAVLSLMLLIEWNQYSNEINKQQTAFYADAVEQTAPQSTSTTAPALDGGIPSVSTPQKDLTLPISEGDS